MCAAFLTIIFRRTWEKHKEASKTKRAKQEKPGI